MSTAPRPDYPFAAVVGQDSLKTALILSAINPRIGGLLISGPRGSAKSTLARGLADILPAGRDGTHSPFVNLPLGTTEDRLLGTLDLERALNDRSVTFHPGLLARAHGGVLYVDEVNLLPDALVDLLLDTSARGINVVERDGISHSHEARFVLVGTMNPDEGELRPQLLDRFGLSLQMSGDHNVAERVAIVRQREAYERDPHGFVEQHRYERDTLRQRIEAARDRLDSTHAPDEIYIAIAEHCLEAGVEGVRADVVWLQAAMTHAAWQGRTEVTSEDLDRVAPWVLAHRRHRETPTHNPPPPRSGSAQDSAAGSYPASGASQDKNQSAAGDNAWGAMPPQRQTVVEAAPLPAPKRRKPLDAHTSGAPSHAGSRRRGTAGQGTHAGPRDSGQPDWFATLAAGAGQWPPRQWRLRPRRSGQPWLNLILIDTSGSTLKQQLFGRAKGLVAQLAQQAYRAREQFAVLGFGNDQVQELLPRRRAPKSLAEQLDQWTGGGGTPLRQALEQASRRLRRWRRRDPQLQVRTWLITDGRTRESLDNLPPLGDCVVVDVEQSCIRRGRCRELARGLGADYLTLPAQEAL